jgi:hypothetical protein
MLQRLNRPINAAFMSVLKFRLKPTSAAELSAGRRASPAKTANTVKSCRWQRAISMNLRLLPERAGLYASVDISVAGRHEVLNNFTAACYETGTRATVVGMELAIARVGAILGPWSPARFSRSTKAQRRRSSRSAFPPSRRARSSCSPSGRRSSRRMRREKPPR